MKTIYVDDDVAAAISDAKKRTGKKASAVLREFLQIPAAPRLYQVEFPDFGALPFDPELFGLTDTSWHNDTSPSFSVIKNVVHAETLWVEYEDPAKREMHSKRFLYFTYDPRGVHSEALETLLDTDDVAEAVQFLHSRLVQRVGDAFAAVLKGWLSRADFREMRERNAAETDASVCHSHDHCDANMAMDEALRGCGFAAMLDAGDLASKEENAHLWNSAWDYAKAAHLTAKAAA